MINLIVPHTSNSFYERRKKKLNPIEEFIMSDYEQLLVRLVG